MPVLDPSEVVTYATVAEARAFGLGKGMTDAQLEVWLAAATEVVDAYTETRFAVAVATTKTFYNADAAWLPIYGPFSDVLEITSDGVVVASSQYDAERLGIHLGSVGTRRTVAVTAFFGHTELPAAVKQATLFIARNLIAASSQRPTVGTDAEGNATTLPTAAYIPGARLGDGSTGSVNADRLLEKYRSHIGDVMSVPIA